MIEVVQTEAFTGWFDRLADRSAASRILTRIRRLELGNVGDAKSIGKGLS